MPPAVTYKMEWTWNTAIDQSTIKGHMGSTGREWHGRKTSSLIFGPSGDSKGSVGCAPDAQPLLIHTSMYYWDIKEAIDTARNNGAKVINMSFGGGWSGFWQYVTSSVTAAYNENRIMVASTGNDGYDTGFYPAAYSEVMGVAALNRNGGNATSTDWGGTNSSNTANADLWAPGTQVAVVDDPGAEGGYTGGNWGRQFVRVNGTSFSAPIVSGAIAACVERGYLSSANTTSAINFMRTWSYGYPAGRSLNAIYAVE
jgi:subtilisin family serine protease